MDKRGPREMMGCERTRADPITLSPCLSFSSSVFFSRFRYNHNREIRGCWLTPSIGCDLREMVISSCFESGLDLPHFLNPLFFLSLSPSFSSARFPLLLPLPLALALGPSLKGGLDKWYHRLTVQASHSWKLFFFFFFLVKLLQSITFKPDSASCLLVAAEVNSLRAHLPRVMARYHPIQEKGSALSVC